MTTNKTTKADTLATTTGSSTSKSINKTIPSTVGGLSSPAQLQYGWVCPKCGSVMSPWQGFCPHCMAAPQPSWGGGITWTPNWPSVGEPIPVWNREPTVVSIQGKDYPNNPDLSVSYATGDVIAHAACN